MTRRLFPLLFLALALLLAACADSGGVVAPAPELARVDGLATADTADTQIRLTQAAELKVARIATAAAAATQERSAAEIALLDKQMQATQVSWDLISTQAAGTAQAQASQIAATDYAAKATQNAAATGTPQAATQAAIVLKVEQDRQDAARAAAAADFRAGVYPIALLFVGGAVVIALVMFVYKLADKIIDRIGAHTDASIIPTKLGPAARVYVDGEWKIYLLASPPGRKALPPRGAAMPDEGRFITPSVVEYPVTKRPPETTAELALRLVQAAETVAGALSRDIPGWRSLPEWNSDPWQRAVRALVAAGAAEKKPDGQYIVTYESLADLEDALEHRRVRVRPAPYLANAPAGD